MSAVNKTLSPDMDKDYTPVRYCDFLPWEMNLQFKSQLNF